MILDELQVPIAEFERGTGWQVKPEGACRGDICVPLQDAVTDGTVRIDAIAERLGMPLVHEPEAGLWSLGPASLGGRALPTAEAPELELPDVEGVPFRLSALRGQKVLLVAWAPY